MTPFLSNNFTHTSLFRRIFTQVFKNGLLRKGGWDYDYLLKEKL